MNHCGFHTGDSSITIPYLSLPELCGFICCVIVYEGSIEGHFLCSIYQDSKQVGMDEGRLESFVEVSNNESQLTDWS